MRAELVDLQTRSADRQRWARHVDGTGVPDTPAQAQAALAVHHHDSLRTRDPQIENYRFPHTRRMADDTASQIRKHGLDSE